MVTWAVGAVVVGVGFAAALAVSEPGAVWAPVPLDDVAEGERVQAMVVGLEHADRLYSLRLERLDDGNLLVMSQTQGVVPPDQLVYWSDEPHELGGDEVSGVLLGGLSRAGSRFALPPGADPFAGTIAVYSLAHHQVTLSTTFGDEDGDR